MDCCTAPIATLIKKIQILIVLLCVAIVISAQRETDRPFYEEPFWKPNNYLVLDFPGYGFGHFNQLNSTDDVDLKKFIGPNEGAVVLSGDNFRNLSDAIKALPNMKILAVRKTNILNNFNKDSCKISELKQLEKLSVSASANFEYIGPESLTGLQKLSMLRIANNPKLSKIDDDALAYYRPNNSIDKYYPPIKYLDLFNNNLTIFPSGLIENWKSIYYIDIRKNPWNCTAPENHFLINNLTRHMIGINSISLNETYCFDGEKKILLKDFRQPRHILENHAILETPTSLPENKISYIPFLYGLVVILVFAILTIIVIKCWVYRALRYEEERNAFIQA